MSPSAFEGSTVQGSTVEGSAYRDSAVEVRVSATSANLGPGFDTMGLALALHDHLTIEVCSGDEVRVEVVGEGAGELPADATHLVVRAMRVAFDAMGVAMPGVNLLCRNQIPQGRGLGSSAAAIVAGLAAARALAITGPELDDLALLNLATRMEGHPDNVAATLMGGFTLAWMDDSASEDSSPERASAVRLPVHPDIHPVVLVPPTAMPTSTARSMLSDRVERADAVFNIGRAALLVHAMTTDPTVLMSGTADRLHQDARAGAYPESANLVAVLRSVGVPAVISGAGPSVLALVHADGSGTGSDEVVRLAPDGWRAIAVDPDPAGVQVH